VLSDAYISVIEAVKFSSFKSGVKPVITWLNAKDFENGTSDVSILNDYDGIIVPGGFGETGIEGKMAVIKHARENKIPYFGLCYGMQLMLIEYARNVLGLEGANSTEVNGDTPHPVIDILPDQKKKLEENNYGGSMRLGAYEAELKKGTIAHRSYQKDSISERHRHRYEVNKDYIKAFEDAGIIFSGVSPDGKLMEITELSEKEHSFFLGTQFHPEFTARPLDPHPLFTAFIKASIKGKKFQTEEKDKKENLTGAV
jgi:CTP synthase